VDVPLAVKDMIRHASGHLKQDEKSYVPAEERGKVVRTARIWLGIYSATALSCVATQSILPALIIGLPRMYGACMMVVYGTTQHAGLGENVLDHRLNTRTVPGRGPPGRSTQVGPSGRRCRPTGVRPP
jgi:fatty acid desaturase